MNSKSQVAVEGEERLHDNHFRTPYPRLPTTPSELSPTKRVKTATGAVPVAAEGASSRSLSYYGRRFVHLKIPYESVNLDFSPHYGNSQVWDTSPIHNVLGIRYTELMAWKELNPLSKEDYAALERQMADTPDPNSTYTGWGAHPELMELLRQFGYRVTSRYEAYDVGVELLRISEESMAWVELKPLTKSEWTLLDNMMQGGIDPDEMFSATGFHYELEALLQSFGYKPSGRRGVWSMANELWGMTPVEDERGW